MRTKGRLSISLSCPWKRKGQAQTAWERLTTRGSKQRYIKGHPICTAAYTHPHIHKHRLTYLGLLSLKFITSGRTITLADSACVCVCVWTTRGEGSTINSWTVPKTWKVLEQFLHYHYFLSYFQIDRASRLHENILPTNSTKKRKTIVLQATVKCFHKFFSITVGLS